MYFFEPEITFDRVYQNSLVKMLKDLGYLELEETNLENYKEEDWENLKEQWSEMWDELFDEDECIMGKMLKGGEIDFFETNDKIRDFFDIVESSMSYASYFWVNEVLQAMEKEKCERGLELHCGSAWFRYNFLKPLLKILFKSPPSLLFIYKKEEIDKKVAEAFKNVMRKLK